MSDVPDNYHPIITLCGSIRFENEFRIVNGELTMKGYVVLAPGFFNHAVLHMDQYNAERTKTGLDDLHVHKIGMSDSIFVIDVLGYIGESTRREIEVARKNKKEIFYWSKGDLFRL